MGQEEDAKGEGDQGTDEHQPDAQGEVLFQGAVLGDNIQGSAAGVAEGAGAEDKENPGAGRVHAPP